MTSVKSVFSSHGSFPLINFMRPRGLQERSLMRSLFPRVGQTFILFSFPTIVPLSATAQPFQEHRNQGTQECRNTGKLLMRRFN